VADLPAAVKVVRRVRFIQLPPIRDYRQLRERLWQPETRRLYEARLYLDAISTQWDEALERGRPYSRPFVTHMKLYTSM
jgi:hypothetical protein